MSILLPMLGEPKPFDKEIELKAPPFSLPHNALRIHETTIVRRRCLRSVLVLKRSELQCQKARRALQQVGRRIQERVLLLLADGVQEEPRIDEDRAWIDLGRREPIRVWSGHGPTTANDEIHPLNLQLLSLSQAMGNGRFARIDGYRAPACLREVEGVPPTAASVLVHEAYATKVRADELREG
ncbi:MAG TPA: hypothetical protein VIL09_12720 [Microvirga sp.]|jgi:hypothetical protein